MKKKKISAKKQKVSVNNRYKEEANGNSELKNTITKKKNNNLKTMCSIGEWKGQGRKTVNLKTEK